MPLGSKAAGTRSTIPFSRAQAVGREDEYLAEATRSGALGAQGPFVGRCEALLQGELGAPVILTKSCTAALELSALLLDLEEGDEVIVPSFAYITTASAFALHGAKIVFADVVPDRLTIDPESVRRCLSDRTRAVVALHYGGVGCDVDPLLAMAREVGALLIEDNAHGTGGTHGGRSLGAIGNLGTLSFHETKNITCGEGGGLVLGDPTLRARAEILAQKGTDRARFMRGEVARYTWVDVGSSYSLSNLHAAFLFGQLEERAAIAARREQQWTRYGRELAGWASAQGVTMPRIPEDCGSTHHIFHMLLPDTATRDRFLRELAAEGIKATFHFLPLHRSPVGLEMGGDSVSCPVAESSSARLARLPLFHGMSDVEQDRVIAAVQRFRV